MNELAHLGVAMDSKQLRDGKAALDALVPSAQKAEKGIDRFNAAAHGLKTVTGGAATGVDRVRAAAAAAVAPTDRFGKAALGAGTAMKTVQMAAAGASAPINNLIGGLTRVTTATGQADAHIKAYRASLASVPAAANSASSSLARLGAAANDNINRLQSTPGNIAAQFQDIGVTAAGGMSPLLIALQQGTQLSAAMQGGVGNLIAGLRQLFNMTTILTIGFVALLAAGLQMVDWMRVAEVLANGLADGLDMLADFVEDASVALVYFGVVAGIAFAPAIYARVIALATAIGATLYGMIGKATVAMIVFASANPFGAIVIAIGLVITAMSLLNDKFGGVFTGILNTVRQVANAIIHFFASAFNGVLKAGETVVNGLISAFEGFTGFLGINMDVGRVDTSGFRIDVDPNRDYVGDIGAGISSALSAGGDLIRGLLPSGASEVESAGAGRASSGQSEAERQAEAYAELIKRSVERVQSLTDEAKALGMTEAAGRLFLNQQALLRDAASQDIELTEARREELMKLGQAMTDAQIAVSIREQTRAFQEQMQTLRDQADLIGLTGRELIETATFQKLFNDAVRDGRIDVENMTDRMTQYVQTLRTQASAIADATVANQGAEFMAEAIRDLELQTAALERSRGEIGLTGAALEAYRIESDLLNKAARENIELSAAEIDLIRQKAVEYAELNEQITEQRRRFEDARQTLRGFFGDMVSGLQQGQSVWKAFGNAVMNVVNRIINRLLDSGTDSLLGSLGRLFGGKGATGGNSGLVSTVGQNLPAILRGTDFKFAKGGAFDTGGVQAFAKGGAFTNGIYSDPTIFKFAKGGAFGMMGEAGPEAVMPLKRGSDGSLGVRVTAMEPQEVVVRVVTDDDRFDAYVDTRIGQSAPQVAQAGAIISERERAFTNTRRLA